MAIEVYWPVVPVLSSVRWVVDPNACFENRTLFAAAIVKVEVAV